MSVFVFFWNVIVIGKLDVMFVGGCGIINLFMNVNYVCFFD